MSGDGLCSDFNSIPFQPALVGMKMGALVGVKLKFWFWLMPLSDSPWLCAGKWTIGVNLFSVSGCACEIGVAAVTVSGAPDIGEATVFSR